ncbi:dienelactone hydrolase family protein [Marimonas lutisalis]|uniref:dienelactone hydrolase family protein n=1 Tax=Marimonas lutisalis TaxID=2545756 RepID=UPI0010F7FD43|nr:dienelactone hydrolase family protein [Marimonas lutisalis]
MQIQKDILRSLVFIGIGAAMTLVAGMLSLGVVLGGAGPVSAGERVTFETPPVQPSAFRIKRAKAQGKTLEPEPGITLSGVLSMPQGDGPHPAIVILPESVEARPSYDAWADHLSENGFVTLIVESLVSRNETILRDDLPMNLLVDAQGALVFLSTLEAVDRERIGLLGIGMSGWFVQRSLDVDFSRGAEGVSFHAGAAIYPHCIPDMKLGAPILVLAGGNDKRMSMAACRALVDLNKPNNARTRLEVYPQATHFFDNIAYAKNPDIRGANWAEPMFYAQNDYDPEARADAEREVVEFFGSVGGPDQATD